MAIIWGALSAIFQLNEPGHYITWGWFQISVSNLIVIILMIALFAVALFAPFPGRNRRHGGDK